MGLAGSSWKKTKGARTRRFCRGFGAQKRLEGEAIFNGIFGTETRDGSILGVLTGSAPAGRTFLFGVRPGLVTGRILLCCSCQSLSWRLPNLRLRNDARIVDRFQEDVKRQVWNTNFRFPCPAPCICVARAYLGRHRWSALRARACLARSSMSSVLCAFLITESSGFPTPSASRMASRIFLGINGKRN